MDQDVKDKMHRVVGQLEALDAAAAHAFCMPSDAATVAIINSIRLLTNHAVISASRYAEEQSR